MIVQSGDPGGMGVKGHWTCSWSQAMAILDSFTNCAGERSSTSASSSDINMDAPATAEEAPTFVAQPKPTTTSATAGFEPHFLSKFFCGAFGKAQQSNKSSTTSTEESLPESVSTRDSGVAIDNAVANSDRIKNGHWDENFINGFDNAHRTFIDTKEKLKAFLPILLNLKASTPAAAELACDSEGCKLGRYGSLTIFQMRIRSLQHSYIFDVLALGGRAMFDMEGSEGESLRKVLESKQHIQIWWDLRQDQDAFLHHFGITLGNRVDVQLMELATRNFPQRDRISSLKNAVRQVCDTWMTTAEAFEWERQYDEAKSYFAQSDYECFNVRPLAKEALEYSAGDVEVIEKLYDVYFPNMNIQRWAFVNVETDARASLSLLPAMPAGSSWAPASVAAIPIVWVGAAAGTAPPAANNPVPVVTAGFATGQTVPAAYPSTIIQPVPVVVAVGDWDIASADNAAGGAQW